jgi:acetyl-CoA decarbonylase/synthase complex subunit delta
LVIDNLYFNNNKSYNQEGNFYGIQAESPEILCLHKTVVIGTGENAVTLGGENVLPLSVLTLKLRTNPKSVLNLPMRAMTKSFPVLPTTMPEQNRLPISQKRLPLCPERTLSLSIWRAQILTARTSPLKNVSRSAKKSSDAVAVPVVISGSKNHEKDAKLFDKIADALQGRMYC